MKRNKMMTQVLAGFLELLPKEQLVFDHLKGVIEETYKIFGFTSIDTPAIERSEILLAKAGGDTEKQIYRFTKGDNDLSLRFDLTVPLARYVSEHFNEITFPFRRYQIAKVYRGESPQKGRFREFYQCDIDIIGNGDLSLMNDAEIPAVIYTVFKKMNIGKFIIRISNRKLIVGLTQNLGIEDMATEVMRVVDKIEKVGPESFIELLKGIGLEETSINEIIRFVGITGTNDSIISQLENLGIQNPLFIDGVQELKKVIALIRNLDIPDEYIQVDLSIARGLDYYTGTVYETVLVDNPKLGSICSGGRYDNLADKYTDKKLPGVGISIGLTRLFSQLRDAGLITFDRSTMTKVLIVPMTLDMTGAFNLASTIRRAGIACEVYHEVGKIKAKIGYADKQGIPLVIFLGENEISAGTATIKNLKTGSQETVELSKVIYKIQEV